MATVVEGEIRRTDRPTEIQYAQTFVVTGDDAVEYAVREMKFFRIVDSRPGRVEMEHRWSHVKDRTFG